MRPFIRFARVFVFGFALLLLPFAAPAKGGHGSGHGGGHGSSHGGSATSFSSGHRHGDAVTPSATRSATTAHSGSGCASRDDRGNCLSYGARGAADRGADMRGVERRDTEISVP